MLILLAMPVFIAVAAMHRYLAVFAPTNVLVRRVCVSEPRWRTAALLAAVALALLAAMHGAASAVASGAPGWLNIVVLVLAWDAIKVGLFAMGVFIRRLLRAVRCWRQDRPYGLTLFG
ncbi:hypothetical protein [Nocardioides allogilvus]|uniref:hypothetical protein n=1 Tax=Nocardioides allogilvus TaxID=2072017 RepID=UPI000D326FF6|nr:hypothetical protein [Nocardioides allogilvus]